MSLWRPYPAAVCGALPPVVVANGRWPQSCIDTADNETCTAVCSAPREFMQQGVV